MAPSYDGAFLLSSQILYILSILNLHKSMEPFDLQMELMYSLSIVVKLNAAAKACAVLGG